MISLKPTNIDYIKKYFQIPTLTKIHREPNILDSQNPAKKKIKANAGCDAHGYLGLLLYSDKHNHIAPGTSLPVLLILVH